MKIVYIAGPYGDAGGYLQIDRNIARAREAAARLYDAGIGCLTPHLNSAHFEAITPHIPVSFWYELDEELLKRCDAVYVLEGWTESKGTKREIDLAIALGLRVFYQGDSGSELDSGEWGELVAWAKDEEPGPSCWKCGETYEPNKTYCGVDACPVVVRFMGPS